jgi:CRP-like cAMP-binding protein
VHVLLAGESSDLLEVAGLLTHNGHHVTLLPAVADANGGWVDGHGVHLAHSRSALAPGERRRQVLLTALSPEPDTKPDQPAWGAGRLQRYEAGQRILVPRGSTLRLAEGIVALSAVHPDGAEVIIGMLGPGDFVLPHPDDSCHVEVTAQSDVQTQLFTWPELADTEPLAPALASRVLRAEAWAAAQAHPYIEQRLLGILSLLAEQFGVDHEAGRMIMVRITHGQLAAITGATRPTITRVLAALRRAGRIAVVGSGSEQRLCILGDES